MSGSATVTAPIGAAVSASALSFVGIRGMNFDTLRQSIEVTLADGQVKSFDAHATSTVTVTASSGVFTFTIQQ